MARSIRHGGVTTFIPGALSEVVVADSAPVGPVIGVVTLIGEADGGVPGTVIQIDDPSKAKALFGSGPLADAIGPAFKPSLDAAIPGGVGRVYAVKTNKSTAAHLQVGVPEDERSDGKIVYASASDDTFQTISPVFAATDVGAIVEILTATANTGAVGRFEINAVIDASNVILKDLSSKSTATESPLKYRIIRPQLEFASRGYGAATESIAVAIENGVATGSKSVRVSQGANVEQSGDLGGSPVITGEYRGGLSRKLLIEAKTATSTDLSKIEVDASTSGGFAADDLLGRFAEVLLGTVKNIRKIKKYENGVTNDLITTFNPFSADPNGLPYNVIEGVVFSGGPSANNSGIVPISTYVVSTNVVVTFGTAPGSPAITFNSGTDDLAGMVLVITDGAGAGQRRIIESNTTTAVTLVSAFETDIDNTSSFEIHYILDAKFSVYGAGGKAIKALAYARVNGQDESDIVSVVITPTMTLQKFVDVLNASGKYSFLIADGVPETTSASELDYGPQSDNFGIELREDAAGLVYANMMAVENWVSGNSTLVSASRSTESHDGTIIGGLKINRVLLTDTVDIAAGWVQIGDKILYYGGTTGYNVALTTGIRELYLAIVVGILVVKNNLDVGSYPCIKLANTSGISTLGSGAEMVKTGFVTLVLENGSFPVSQVGGNVPAAELADTFLGTQILHGSTSTSPSYPKADSGSTTTLTDTSARFAPSSLVGRVIEFPISGTQRSITANTATSITFAPAISAAVTSTTVYRVLNKGIRGISTNTDWQEAADLLLRKRINHVCPLADQDLSLEGLGSTATIDSIHAIFKDHALTAEGAAKSERNVYLSLKGTKDQLKAKGKNLNYRQLVLAGTQAPDLTDVSGNLKTFPNWGNAVICMSMRAGAEIGLPLTRKMANIQGLTSDSSFDPLDVGDQTELIESGVMFMQPMATGGFRWVRDMTTHLKDDNVTFFQDSSNTALNFVTYDTRSSLEDAFIGGKAVPNGKGGRASASTVTVAAIKNFVDTKIDGFVRQNIVAEYDPTTTRVQISGNIATLIYSIKMVNGLDFVKITAILQLPQNL